ncbi:MAG TPA: hypothetical protein VFJ48_04220 [Casimicrobiaceae bacterium]|nr:hypothetical protein [Casimicrobiaceae bacterium]
MTILLREDKAGEKDKGVMVQDVFVNVTPVFGDGAVCEITAGDGPSHAFVHGGVINLRGNSQFQVTWQLQSAGNLEFDRGEPLWSSQAQCPADVCHDDQFAVTSCTGTTLVTLVTPKKPPNAVHVSLGWSNGNRFDPIIINN